MKIPRDEAVEATAGRPTGTLPDALEIATDTRTLRAGQTFLALRGERFDGHDHVASAFENGAAAAIVARAEAVPAGYPALVVEDTLAAYLALAGCARDRLKGPVVAISGSTGKTTTKAFALALLLAAGVPTTATPENENNEIGVAKFLLGLDDGDARVAIVEMGARKYRDLDPLVDTAQPDVSILTNAGEAHIEIMGSRERIAETKWGLFRRGARAVLSLADEASRARAATLPAPPVWFGIGNERPPAGERAIVVRGAAALAIDGERIDAYPVDLHLPGDHNARNAAAALALGVVLGLPLDKLAPHAAAMHLPPGRYDRSVLDGDVHVIYDAYNASMSGTLATLDAFSAEEGRRIVVFGGMAELGDEAPAMHARVGAEAARVADVLLVGGVHAADSERGARTAGAREVLRYTTNAAAVERLRALVQPGDRILLKGSRAYKMEEIRDALKPAEAAR